eukprot:gb/GECH01009656.1/.p1 GENE.gb/GECH01009656.1/~~gb/GECH01009656.1/.p1  ORF type:complete len:2079 (+),score=534.85 gb/GECH01009656.1/:1-6237(+)
MTQTKAAQLSSLPPRITALQRRISGSREFSLEDTILTAKQIIDSKRNKFDISNENDEVKNLSSNFTWDFIVSRYLEDRKLDITKQKEGKSLLRELYDICNKIASEHSPQVINDLAASLLVSGFKRKLSVTGVTKNLKQSIGSVKHEDVDKALQSVNQLVHWINLTFHETKRQHSEEDIRTEYGIDNQFSYPEPQEPISENDFEARIFRSTYEQQEDEKKKKKSKKEHNKPKFTIDVLEKNAEKILGISKFESVSTRLQVQQFVDEIMEELEQSKAEDIQLQTRLLELVGLENVDLVTEILQNRTRLISQNKVRVNNRNYLETSNWDLFKARREELENENNQLQVMRLKSNPNIQISESDTERIEKEEWEEMHVSPKYPPPLKEEDLVPISDLDEISQRAFTGYERLNRIQSAVFESAYSTNENLLICAPTGAGKTNIAMLTVCREILNHFENGFLKKDEFKIVYVAPMKALAQEMVANFGRRLSSIGLQVRELTGDMQLSKKEIQNTQMIVTTPEKWDVISRKSNDGSLATMVKLLIIDEVHLLNEDRGPVIESIIARTLRQVESTQNMIRIVGLSATLPNYNDVAEFLKVNERGLFYFDSKYRPVPLKQQFIGVPATNVFYRLQLYNKIAFEKATEAMKNGKQVMIFVHSRKDTFKTAETLLELAREESKTEYFKPPQLSSWTRRKFESSRNNELKTLINNSCGMHHAGMLRSDRRLVEELFAKGKLRLLCCTATLAWGVNLPAHTVIIKGTEIYNPEKSKLEDISILDVQQIFGRAGRPQYDKSGEGIIITSHEMMTRYHKLMHKAFPIESQLQKGITDNLNAEVVLGTVTNVREAMQWLSYTYMFVRMKKNPMNYGIKYEELRNDPLLGGQRDQLIRETARVLDRCRMVRFNENTGYISATDLGRVASHFYIHHTTIELYNQLLQEHLREHDILNLLSRSHEFHNVRVRDDEVSELKKLSKGCPVRVDGEEATRETKVNILLQSFISAKRIDGFALVSDSNFVMQNAGRITRAMFEIALRRGWNSMSEDLLMLTKCIDRKMWAFEHPFKQFPYLSNDIIRRLDRLEKYQVDDFLETSLGEIKDLIHWKNTDAARSIKRAAHEFPRIDISARIQPITRTILRFHLTIEAEFEWNDKIHGGAEPWWIWVEDASNETIYHSEYFLITKKNYGEQHELDFTVPVFEPLPPQYFVHAISDRWLGAEHITPVSFKHLILPDQHPPNTPLADVFPLPVSALQEPKYEALYPFKYYNPVQTQVFHTMYHSDENVLLGAPTGSGKTIMAEMSMFRLFNRSPQSKVVYIGPLKALVRERLKDWNETIGKHLGKNVVELTGDHTPDIKLLKSADIVVSTPEKWDGISRAWQKRSYVRQVGLVIIDEIHLLGQDRGPILEVIVSRMRYIAWHTGNPIRIVGLSTALANARDLGDWLGIQERGLYNFPPSVRPVPVEAHIQGFPGRHYCPRMASMNKPAYSAIMTYSPTKPVLVFVSSRRQTRLTALDLITYCAGDEQPRRFLNLSEEELDEVLEHVVDNNLRHVLNFGVGIHHAGLCDTDKKIVEHLFVNNKIQILVCTSTLAWGVNFPAYLVIVKGTEFFDPKVQRYTDMPITDVLQMMGRAGRPQFDDTGRAMIMVHEPKKSFYKRFLYEPFPVESSLAESLSEHINAETVSGTIACKQDAIDYLTWTYYFRRIIQNPCYYGLKDASQKEINRHLSTLIERVFTELIASGCIVEETRKDLEDEDYNRSHHNNDHNDDDHVVVESTTLGRITSFYYLNIKSARHFTNNLVDTMDIQQVMQLLCNAAEYNELPVRHNEDKLNKELAEVVPWDVDMYALDNPHVKAHLLLQAHFTRLSLPITDYITDTKSVLDQSIRIIQAIVDLSADNGYLITALNIMQLQQMIMQGRWHTDSSLMCLPHVTSHVVHHLETTASIRCLPQFVTLPDKKKRYLLHTLMTENNIDDVIKVCHKFPLIDVGVKIPSKGLPASGGETTVTVNLVRKSKYQSTAYAPRFKKPKEEGWWLVIGFKETAELVSLRRVSLKQKCNINLQVYTPPTTNETLTFTLYLMSDSFIGFDQQYDFQVSVN